MNANSLRYEITEAQRGEILHMLEWAQYGIDSEKSLVSSVGASDCVADSLEEMGKQMDALRVLWDALNDMQPVEVS